MKGFEFLDLVIGLIFIYFILSIVVSVIQEIRANIFKLRAKNLEKWFEDTLKEGDLGEKLLKHRLIAGLVKRGRKPSYIPNEHFVAALLETIAKNDENKPYTIDTLKTAVEHTALLPDDLKRHILQSISEASGKLGKVRNDISLWFDNCMDRVSGTYKNLQQKVLVLIAIIVAGFFNADTISISKYLYSNESERLALVETAINVSEDSALHAITKKYLYLDSLRENGGQVDSAEMQAIKNIKTGWDELKTLNDKVTDLDLPLGWTRDEGHLTSVPSDFVGFLSKFVGLLITGFAVSLGAPFWFDTLNKLVNLRGAGKKPRSNN